MNGDYRSITGVMTPASTSKMLTDPRRTACERNRKMLRFINKTQPKVEIYGKSKHAPIVQAQAKSLFDEENPSHEKQKGIDFI
jgi:hypothetical protein